LKVLKIGDKVISKNGRACKVLKTHKRPFKGDALEVSSVGSSEKIRFTPDHKIFCVSKRGR